MNWKEITDQQQWNQFLNEHRPAFGAFLHSWQWGEFQKSLGQTIHRLGFFQEDKLVIIALLIEKNLPFNQTYFFCPRGPVGMNEELMQESLDLLRSFGKEQEALFLRLEPAMKDQDQQRELRSVRTVTPADTLILDLSVEEDALLAQMHHKTRYNVRLAQKKEVEITIDAAEEIETVWKAFEETAKRGEFRLHTKSYYKKMIENLKKGECHAFVAKAEYQGEVLAVNIMIDHGNVRTYLHGASSNAHRNFMAPYLLHWELIKEAKQKGLQKYDWWGIAPEGAGAEHAWAGVTRFKKGFGGENFSYVGTFDLVFKHGGYQLYQFFRTGIKFLRRFLPI